MSVHEPGPRDVRPWLRAAGAPEPDLLVTVRYWAAAAHAAGVDEEGLAPAPTVAAALAMATERHPALAEVLPACSLLVDGRVVEPDYAVTSGTIIEVLPPFAGG